MMLQNPYIGMPYYNRYSRYGYRYPSSPYYSNIQNDTNIKKNESNFVNNSPKSRNSKPFFYSPTYYGRKEQRKTNHSKQNFEHSQSQYKDSNQNNTQKKEENHGSFDLNSPLFQILGISLYFDDILILCLLFFLYQEGVKDQSLFISLILLLLS